MRCFYPLFCLRKHKNTFHIKTIPQTGNKNNFFKELTYKPPPRVYLHACNLNGCTLKYARFVRFAPTAKCNSKNIKRKITHVI